VVATADRVAQDPFTFDLSFAGDSTNTAAAGDLDYVGGASSATIQGGTAAGTPMTFRTFRLSNDKIDEPVETVKVTATDRADVLAPATGLYSINDDPNDMPPSVSIAWTSTRPPTTPSPPPAR
jgi:xanthine dehydrogenase molybdopterin-binding subunit B